jgi:hypothetical protein
MTGTDDGFVSACVSGDALLLMLCVRLLTYLGQRRASLLPKCVHKLDCLPMCPVMQPCVLSHVMLSGADLCISRGLAAGDNRTSV